MKHFETKCFRCKRQLDLVSFRKPFSLDLSKNKIKYVIPFGCLKTEDVFDSLRVASCHFQTTGQVYVQPELPILRSV